ncbi:MAG: hypothetical protein KZQ98_02675 [Candidatus Thiodiazotropha sp. (ex Lucinoma borealis)]|nr:hypothetical protein [Candidatus Thiodiazotropha sp. (ex Lucinoma borealis)]
MKVLLSRNQKSGIVGKIAFTLNIRAELSDAEKSSIAKYKLGNTMLYERDTLIDRGSGLRGLISRLFYRAVNMSISVDDLTKGKRIECKDVVEMLAIEDQIKEASTTFKAVLAAAASFGGEEVIEV